VTTHQFMPAASISCYNFGTNNGFVSCQTVKNTTT